MANVNSTPTLSLLGKTVYATERVCGFDFERSGEVVGVVVSLPGRNEVSEAILLQLDGITGDYLHRDDITITAIL